jgi:hypothetical protein
MTEGQGLKSASSGIGHVLLYVVAVVFVLLVLAGATALVKHLWHALSA